MPQNQHIQLISPVMEKIPTFIVENSACQACGGLSMRKLAFGDQTLKPEVVRDLLARFTANDLSDADLTLCECEPPRQLPLVKMDHYKGKTVCICGSGPSIKYTARHIKRGEFDHVWGCNDALMWLTQQGYKVTHGVGIDQSPDLFEDCWAPEPPDVPYIIASSVNPKLVKHLQGFGRHVTLFHSHIGFEGEHELYGAIYPGTALAGEGLNVVNRAIGAAEYLGYDKIFVAGADCAFTPKTGKKGQYNFHVHGDSVEGIVLTLNPAFMDQVGGRSWATKPDMLISAISLVNTKKRLGGRLQLLGKTLPKALQHKDQDFLDRCIRFAHPGELEAQQAEEQLAKWAPSKENIQAAIAKNG